MFDEDEIITYFLVLLSDQKNDLSIIVNALVKTVHKFGDEEQVLTVLTKIDWRTGNNPLVNFEIYTDARMEIGSSTIYTNNESEALTKAGKSHLENS